MKKYLFTLFALAASVCGCDKAPVSGSENEPVETMRIPITLTTDIWTKATDTGFEVNDKVGIYTVNYNGNTAGNLVSSGNHIDNVAFTFNGALWNPVSAVYWKDQTTKADFYCYYPYTASVANVNSLPFSVKPDQSTLENYKASELLWGKTEGAEPSENPVNITTRHAMSNVLIYVKAGKGYTDETLAAEQISVVLLGLKTAAKINLANGKVTAEGNSTEMIPFKENGYWRALVVPQDVVGAQLVKVTVGSSVYTLSQTVSFSSNKQHKCTITVNKVSEGINIGIGGWESDDTDFGGTVE